jgi:hypothetical protein
MISISRLSAVAIFTLTAIASPAFGQTMQSETAAHNLPSSSAPSAERVVTAAVHRVASRGGARVYDGVWSVVIETTRGNCPAAMRAGVHIFAGRLLSDDQSYRLNGRVAGNGAVRVTVSAAGQSAGGSGRLWRNVGRGLWRTSLGECSGQWTAERRG